MSEHAPLAAARANATLQLPSTYNEARHRGRENFIVDVAGYGEDTPGWQSLTALFWERSPRVVDEGLLLCRPKATPTSQ